MTDQKIKQLDDYTHTRLRTETLYGSREIESRSIPLFDGLTLVQQLIEFVPALFTCFRELLDNALDEMVNHGHGDQLDVLFDETTLEVSVADNGRGIPLHHDDALGGIVASIALSSARTGRNFEDRTFQAGMNGVGASGVNFTAEWFTVEVHRDKTRFFQRWEEGADDTHMSAGPELKGTRGNKNQGTRVSYRPSTKIFPHRVLPLVLIRSHLWMVAAINPGLKVTLNGETLAPRIGKDPFALTLLKDRPVAGFQIQDDLGDFSSSFYAVPGFVERDEVGFGLVNMIPSWSGMDHVDVFRGLFCTSIMEALAGKAKRAGLELQKKDVSAGLLILNTTKVKDAVFDSQSKSRLTKQSVQSTIRKKFDPQIVANFVKANPEWVELILQRARERQLGKDNAAIDKKQKELRRSKVLKLYPASGTDRSKVILFLMEGDSAIGNIIPARDPKLHAVLPLRGKPMNVFDEAPKKVVENKVFADVMASIGLQIGVKAIRSNLHVGAIYLATDEDPDGQHITCLLVMFFYKYWPELFDPKHPFIYKFTTPLIIAKKGKVKTYYYADNIDVFEKNMHKYAKDDITRAKGLGALEEDDWDYALAKPMVIPIIDDGELEETLSLLFAGGSSGADLRKIWLEIEK